MPALITAMGLMSGTSMDGIDVAVLRTDGRTQTRNLYAKTFPYRAETRALIKDCIGLRDELDPRIKQAEIMLTEDHAQACKQVLAIHPETEIIGFHGQSIWHAPDEGLTRQLGDGPYLADMLQKPVVYDFRSNDMRNGGQGAPLLPLYHAVKARGMPRPLVVANIGGVSNVTWIGEKDDDILAFDTGPGNALINDWMEVRTGENMDRGGKMAAKGAVDIAWIKAMIRHKYFKEKPPKSLDRQDFTIEGLQDKWTIADGAATLTMFTATALSLAQKHFPEVPLMWIITGGGRHNPVMMKDLKSLLPDVQFIQAEHTGWNGDSLEAEGFAYLAVRSQKGLYLTLPQTTGCKTPTQGGILVHPNVVSAA